MVFLTACCPLLQDNATKVTTNHFCLHLQWPLSNSWWPFDVSVEQCSQVLTQHTYTLQSLLWKRYSIQSSSKRAININWAMTVLCNFWTRCFTFTKIQVDPLVVVVCHWISLSEILLWQAAFRKKKKEYFIIEPLFHG